MTKRVLVAFLLSAVLAVGWVAETYANISEAAVLFLRIAAGARFAGMGEAGVALADDGSATHWNPAGLGRYPLSDLWLDVPVPEGRSLADFAVVENDVPEMNYSRYDIWVIARATAGYYISAEIDHPAVEPVTIEASNNRFLLGVDAFPLGEAVLPAGTYNTIDELVAAVQGAIRQSGHGGTGAVTVTYAGNGKRGQLIISSGSAGVKSVVSVTQGQSVLPALLASGSAVRGRPAELMRATPPTHTNLMPSGKENSSGSHAAGKWEKGDEYEPDASEDLASVVRSRTGLREGPELDLRMAQVALLNQRVSTDSLRAWWSALQELPGATVSDSLFMAFEDLLLANDRLNADFDRLQDLLDEMAEIAKAGTLEDDAAYRLLILAQRAVVPYLPERISFPFSFNLVGEVTALASRNRTLWLGTTRGLLMYADERWLALNDSTAGPAAGAIHDLQVSPSGVLWVATDSGVSRFSSVWTHFGAEQGWLVGGCERIFVLGESDVYALSGTDLYRYDDPTNVWTSNFEYTANIGDHLARLPGKVLGVRDSIQAAAFTDSLIRYSGVPAESLEAGQVVKIPYRLLMRRPVTAMAKTSDGKTWLGSERGLVSIARNKRVERYGYEFEEVGEATTVLEVAERYVGIERPERARLLAERIKEDNELVGDSVAAGRVLAVFNGVAGSAIHSLFADGGTLLVGTEFGMVEYTGGDRWYRYLKQGLEESLVHRMVERSGERWFATDHRVVVYAHPRKELTLMHVKWLPGLADDIYYEFAGYVMPIKGWGTVGANVTFLSLGKQQRTTEFGDLLGEFGTFELAFTASYGTKLARTLAAGLSAKVIYSHLADFGAGSERGSGTATGLAVDFGTIWQTPLRRLDLGVAVTNLGPSISYIDASQADPLPRNMGVGLAYRLISTPYNRLTLVGEINKDLIGIGDRAIESVDTVAHDTVFASWLTSQTDEVIFNAGLEYQYGSFIALRAGYIYDRQGDIKKPTLGAGLQYRNLLFDFAYIPSSSANKPLDNTTRLAISVRW